MYLRGTRPKFSPIRVRQLRPRISYSYRGFSFRDVWMLCLLLGKHSNVSFFVLSRSLKSDESSTNSRKSTLKVTRVLQIEDFTSIFCGDCRHSHFFVQPLQCFGESTAIFRGRCAQKKSPWAWRLHGSNKKIVKNASVAELDRRCARRTMRAMRGIWNQNLPRKPLMTCPWLKQTPSNYILYLIN